MATATLGMWSFASAAMLAWGVAAAIPLVIHLWSRRRYREQPWAAMQFLLAAMRKHSHRLRIEQLILLFIRMLLLALLAVALADPSWSWSSNGEPTIRSGATHYLLVVDASFSMSYRDRDQTLFQIAQNKMRQLVESSQEGDGFSMVVMGGTSQAISAEIMFDPAEVLRQIERLQVLHSGADLPLTLSAIEDMLRRVQEHHPRLARHRICFFSDLGQNTWSDASLPSTRETFERLSKQTEMLLYDVGLEEQPNLAVTSLSSTRSVVTPGERLQFTAEIQSFGAGNSVTTRLECLVSGRVVNVQELRVEAGGRQTATWEHTFDSPGDQVVSVRITPDNLPLDNERWLVVPVRESFSVLCIGGEPEAADFVALALNPESRDDAPIHTTLASESSILERNLSDFDCVFLCNIGQITSFEATALHKYVTQGGGLVVSLGDQVQAENYNRELANSRVDGAAPATATDTVILPATIAELQRGEFFFDPLEYRHPLVAPFRGRERAGLLTVPIWRYFRLIPKEGSTVPLALNSGHPAVMEAKVGLGRSILVATALSPSSVDRSAEPVTPWTELSSWPSFPPLMHGLVQLATKGRETARTVIVGSPLQIGLHANDREVFVVRPNQQREPLHVDVSTAAKSTTFVDTSFSGVYQVEIQGESIQKRSYAANLDSRESDLRRVDSSSLPATILQLRGTGPIASIALADLSQLQLFRPLLVLVALLLLSEQLLAVIFARRSL